MASLLSILKWFTPRERSIPGGVPVAPKIPIADNDILGAMNPWTLACGAAAENGSLGARMSFDFWLRASRDNWLPELSKRLGVSESKILRAFGRYVATNRHRDYRDILREEENKRNMHPSLVLGPGESIEIEVPFPPHPR